MNFLVACFGTESFVAVQQFALDCMPAVYMLFVVQTGTHVVASAGHFLPFHALSEHVLEILEAGCTHGSA